MIHERDLQSKCLAWVREHPEIYVINTHGDGWNGNGTPDLTLCVNGRFVAAELKLGENGLSGAQRIHRKRILRSGGIFFAPYTLGEFVSRIEVIMDDGRIRHSERE